VCAHSLACCLVTRRMLQQMSCVCVLVPKRFFAEVGLSLFLRVCASPRAFFVGVCRRRSLTAASASLSESLASAGGPFVLFPSRCFSAVCSSALSSSSAFSLARPRFAPTAPPPLMGDRPSRARAVAAAAPFLWEALAFEFAFARGVWLREARDGATLVRVRPDMTDRTQHTSKQKENTGREHSGEWREAAHAAAADKQTADSDVRCDWRNLLDSPWCSVSRWWERSLCEL
jgi:hypothetical protein